MAYEPSKRRKSEELDMELDIRPVMNLMVVLIPLLLAGAEFVKVGIIEINLPPAKTLGPGQNKDQLAQEKEKQKLLNLKLVITDQGITIGNDFGILRDASGKGPTVGKTPDGKYDFAKLTQKLIELKNKIANQGFVDENRVIMTAEPQIKYQTIIKVMDHVQTYVDETDHSIKPLFPEVSFAKML